MPLALSIQPFSDVLDMYGDADSSSTFSLSGHISISLSSPASLFARRRTTTRILLQSLTITFEGQSETLSPGTGYACVRLCSVTRELLPSDPVDLSNEGHEDSDKPCMWNVIFDIPVPGWLPTTSVYGDASLPAAGTSYALYATATFVDTNHGHSSLSFANICGPVRSRTRTVDAPRRPVILRRFVEPGPESSPGIFEMSVYIVDAGRAPDSNGSSRRSIPSDVLEKIQVVASIPSATAMDETSIPFILRVRAKDMDDSERTKLKIIEFSVDVEQVEVYRNSSSRNDIDQYPIPSQNHQPPRVPLRNPHPIHTLYDTGFLGTFRSSIKRSFSILAPTESGRYVISGDGRIFAQDHNQKDNWYILETKIPVFAEPYLRDWAGTRKRRITERSPLFCVEHYMHVVIRCEYDLADSDETILERLHFSLPMRHVNVPEIPSGNVIEHRCEDPWKNVPVTHTLPAYSQLFHSNGERKLDYSIPLPPYEAPSACSPFGLASDQQRTL
ncbi:hypothetical protein JVT61DRAFT_2227 [Boletus reticuloceps]|uniref:Uncharacterized protein n=1 Tax=Boletus reticuloceps TaxID=495285 RepID=A0A8I3AB43_9AGAM|nr:hypothetical protein JVT61DRAFT_2227 [Boletus reticuloceps]